MPVISDLGRHRQKDLKFKTSLDNMNWRTARATEGDPISKTPKQKQLFNNEKMTQIFG
jgi:hypothetical protein